MLPVFAFAINAETPLLLPLGMVCTLLIALVGVVWHAANRIRDLTEQLKDMQRDIRASWTFRDMEKWALNLERENRSRKIQLFVPEVERAPDENKSAEPA